MVLVVLTANFCWCIRHLGGRGITIQTAPAPVNTSVRYTRLREEEQEDTTSSQRAERTAERQKCWRWCASQGTPPHSLCEVSQRLCAEASLSTSSASGENQTASTLDSGSPELRPSPRLCRCQATRGGSGASAQDTTEDSYIRDYPPVSSASSTPVPSNNNNDSSGADSFHHVAPRLNLHGNTTSHSQRAHTST